MKDILNGKRLILGSGSPRRAQLLEEMDIPYDILCLNTDESYPKDTPANQVAEYLAIKKSIPYMDNLKPHEVVLTADSIVIHNDTILEKPTDLNDARQMIAKMSGNTHQVITGYCIRSQEKMVSNSVVATVSFRTLDAEEVAYYVSQYKPLDKAGSYGIQEWIGHIGIETIQGTYTNIMGLPTYEVYRDLKEFCR